ncbi:MAG: ABC transporter ATP-binding protein [Nanoarchaeota archaeon]|nr:ABC transporter ATP-binding protein [Nanoarchaeota archaeon]
MKEITREKLNYPLKNFLGDLWHFLGKHRFKFIILSLIIAIASFLELIPPIITSKIIDFFTTYSKGQPLDLFYIYIAFLFAILIIGTFLRLGGKHFFSIYANTVQKEVKTESFQKLMEGDLFWHDKENTGNKMQKISDGVSAIGSLMDFYINSGISMVVSVVGIIIILTYFGFKYALIAIAFMLVYLIIDFSFNKKLGKKTLDVQIAKEKAAGKAYEFSSNIATVKSLGIEKSANEEVYSNEETILQARNERRKVSTTKWTTVQLISVIFYVIFTFIVGRDIVLEVVTIGSIVIYLSYVAKIQSTLNQVSGYSDMLIDTRYSIYRMMGLYKSIPKINEEGAVDLEKWDSLTAENLSFKYRNEEVLENFNFKINRGEKIGIVGISGSGKSTLFKLLLKLYLPQKGMIYFDSKPITGLKRDSITKKISIVPQETEVFNISFRENVTISTPGNINYKKYKQALELSQCVPIISKLKDKDLTLMGEKGVRLSGGEKQRLGIARALYKGSDVFIFDESTSNLDYETERKIQDAFDKEFKDKTLIFAAHRLSTLRNMDKILVIERGKIVEEGSYNKLVREKGEFYRILKKQESKNKI